MCFQVGPSVTNGSGFDKIQICPEDWSLYAVNMCFGTYVGYTEIQCQSGISLCPKENVQWYAFF